MEKFAIITYGCVANKSDSEIMAGILLSQGYKMVDSIEEANIVIVNTCSVKHSTEEKIISFLKRISKLDKKIVITGCLVDTHIERIKKEVSNYFSLVNVGAIGKIALAVKKKGEYIEEPKENKLKLPFYCFNEVIGIIQISEGCLGNCNYCIVKFARKRLRSFPKEDIIERVKYLLSLGKREIWITSQDTAIYGFDINSSLPELLKDIVSIEGKFFVRIGMMNPFGTKKIEKDLIKIYKNEKIFKFIHLPLQSGSNKVLADMNRFYTIEDFLNLIENFRKEIANISIATDIIVGYPTESEEDFKKTLEIIEEIKPAFLNISQFSSRPKTFASKLKKLPTQVVKERSVKLTKLYAKIKENLLKKEIGKEYFGIIDEIVKVKGEEYFVLHSENYLPIYLKCNGKASLGKFARVKVIGKGKNYLLGKILKIEE